MALTRINNQALTNVTSAGLPSGSVLQVVEGKYEGTAGTDTTLTDGTWTDLSLSASITPTSTSSKILVQVNLVYYVTSAAGFGARLLRGSTSIYDPSPSGATGPYIVYSNTNPKYGTCNFSYMDSPSTTSSTTYKVQGNSYNTNDAYVPNNGTAGYNGASMSIILMEIAG